MTNSPWIYRGSKSGQLSHPSRCPLHTIRARRTMPVAFRGPGPQQPGRPSTTKRPTNDPSGPSPGPGCPGAKRFA